MGSTWMKVEGVVVVVVVVVVVWLLPCAPMFRISNL